jgi:hypothetical protein
VLETLASAVWQSEPSGLSSILLNRFAQLYRWLDAPLLNHFIAQPFCSALSMAGCAMDKPIDLVTQAIAKARKLGSDRYRSQPLSSKYKFRKA